MLCCFRVLQFLLHNFVCPLLDVEIGGVPKPVSHTLEWFGQYKQGEEEKTYRFELYMEDTSSIRGKVFIPWNKTEPAALSDSSVNSKRNPDDPELTFPAISKEDFFQMYRSKTDTDFGGMVLLIFCYSP